MEKRNVPKLRFKGFEDEWSTNNINDISEIIDGDRGVNYPKENEFHDKGFCLFLNAKNVTRNGFKFEILNFISREKDCILKKGKLKRNDIVLTTRGTVGNIAFYDLNIGFENLRINSGMVLLRPIKIYPQYLYSYMSCNNLRKQIDIISFGSAQPQLTVKDIKRFKVNIPSVEEQTKIANFLSNVDNIIEEQEGKVKDLEQYKKGMMQKIFKQEVRFKDDNGGEYPEWEEKKLGNVANIIGGGTPSTGESEYWDGNIQWFTPTEIKNRKYISKSIRTITNDGLKNSSAKLLPKGTILLSTRATLGEMAILENEATTNQGFQSLNIKEGFNNEFIYYLKDKIKKYCYKNSSGSTFLEISKSSLEKFKTKYPCLQEQTKIANFLCNIDNIIEEENKKLEDLKLWKKGLLQQMFV